MAIPRIQSYPMPQADSFPNNKMEWQLDASRAVLLVHDTQEYFMNFYDQSKAPIPEMINNIQKLLDAARAQKIPVAYTAQPASQTLEERGLLQPFWGPGIMGKENREKIIEALSPQKGDVIIDKWRYSAFKNNNFHKLFKDGRDQLIIVGVYGHIGCLTTANEAFMNDIQAFFIADAVADFSLEDQTMAMKWITKCCGMVQSTEETLAQISPKPSSAAVITLKSLRKDVANILQIDEEEIYPDDNLIYTGLDSIRLMTLAEKWKKIQANVSFADLAKKATLEEWAELFASRRKTLELQNA